MDPDGATPMLYVNDDADLLLAAVRTLPGTPDLPDIPSARLWLANRGPSAGWFDRVDDLLHHLEKVATDNQSALPKGSRTGRSLLELLV